MKLRYTIRAALVATTIIAVACGWYARNVSQRQREVAILNDLERVTDRGVVIADGVHPYDGCGTWSGAMAHLDFRGPAILRKLNLDAFKRVVRIEVQYEKNPEIIATIGRFQYLDEAFFDNGSFYAGEELPPEELDYLNAVRQFRSTHPMIAVQFWDYDEPDDTIN